MLNSVVYVHLLILKEHYSVGTNSQIEELEKNKYEVGAKVIAV